MFKMTDRKYKQKLKQIELQNQSYKLKQSLKAAKLKKARLPSTSKIVLFSMILLCAQIIIFAEFAMIFIRDMSAMYALIGIPVALSPTIWGYYSKSKAENTKGGITYETTMANINNSNNSINEDDNHFV